MFQFRDSRALELPAAGIADEVNAQLSRNASLVITAPPGAGKSTLLPLTILDGVQDGGKVLVLEPRRLAAIQIAGRMSSLAGESVGGTVGYRVRFDSRVSDRTRVEVLTEGILTRMLVDDPTLEGVSVVVFDEFHERSINSDVALALVREAQRLVRPDLKMVIMSASIDASAICAALGAPLVESDGRMFPVEVIRPGGEAVPENAAELVAHTIRAAHREHEGDILAFLPGEADIRRCQELLGDALGQTRVMPLFGMLSPQEQREAIAPSLPGERKVVLATPVAETSITIEGVRIVVDSGLCRKMVFDPQKALSHLETVRISKDMALQRTGRAGRVAPGVCYRLWSAATESRMAECRTPEILYADLAPTVLSIAAWGEGRLEDLPWLDLPPVQNIALARRMLTMMGALTEEGVITAHGRKVAAVPCHPRIAQMLVRSDGGESKALAADIAALLEEKDPMAQGDADFTTRVNMLRDARRSGRGLKRLARTAEQYLSLARVQADNSPADPFETGALLAAAYPERVGQALGGGRFLLANGEIASAGASDLLASFDWIVAASVSLRPGAEGRVFLGCPVSLEDLLPLGKAVENVCWDTRRGAVAAQNDLRLGRLVLESKPLPNLPSDRVSSIICEAAKKEGVSMLDFSDEVENLQRRVAAAASWHPELELPSLATSDVLSNASEWLPMYLGKASSAAELKKIDLCAALWAMLSYEQQKAVERIAPSFVEVPTGSHIRLEYRIGAEAPVLRVRLQECFGLLDTPCVDDGRRPVLMELLSPGFKPVQLTSDLRSFWEGTYFEVRKELRRRYPKHSWPDDPLAAVPVRGVRRS